MLVDTVKELTRRDYELFRKLVYAQSGIDLGDQKMQLVRARLGKRLRARGFKSYRDYYEFVKADRTRRELAELIDAISTNTTHLFRENQHFEFLAGIVKRWASASGPRRRIFLRIWSAGCSSGEEPYSVAMTMDDAARHHPALRYKILATDISTRVLARARTGIFPADRLARVPPEFRRRYFRRVKRGGETVVQIRPELGRQIKFARFNLMDERFPFRNGFDVIFCRNVMIYFDRPTQEALVAKFCHVMNRGGYLLIGHSESLNNITHPFIYVMPTIYKKP
jgi:chemotaxis protein methyltransferase CheR